MTSAKYVETITGGLDRLQGTGFYLSGSFANHAPMVAEALATLGYCDEVDSWIDANLDRRQPGPLPRSRHKISVRAWRGALGHHARGGDWVELFRDELAATAWRTVLAKWWPRLLPGIGGSLTHGLIRTAHAVRGLAAADEPSDLQIDELGRGLAFWATVYSPLSGAIEAVPDADPTLVGQSLSQLTDDTRPLHGDQAFVSHSANPHHHRSGSFATGPCRTARPARNIAIRRHKRESSTVRRVRGPGGHNVATKRRRTRNRRRLRFPGSASGRNRRRTCHQTLRSGHARTRSTP